MGWLLDTNVLSELRKGKRCDAGVAAWSASVPSDDLWTSALVVGEIRRGIESVRRRDAPGAVSLDAWIDDLAVAYAERVLVVSVEIAEEWGRLSVPDPLPIIDGLLAATAKVHRLTLVTRNVRDVARTGVSCLDPFSRKR